MASTKKGNGSRPISMARAFSYFAFFTLLLYVATRHVIPLLNTLGLHPALSWFFAGGIFVFGPMFFIAIRNVGKETGTSDRRVHLQRLWLLRPSSGDWIWSIGGLVVILLLTGLIMYLANRISLSYFHQPFRTSPSFMHFEPLEAGSYWILLVWMVFFFFNIMGEEIMWRGYLLAGLSEKYPRSAWLYNAVFWMMFHIPFGYELMIMVLPTFFIIPYVVQKRKNTWIGIIIHAGLNGPGFILVSLGLLNH